MKENVMRFSFTSDETTLINNRRYINVVLKSSTEKFNLGLKGIEGEANAENIALELKNILVFLAFAAAVVVEVV